MNEKKQPEAEAFNMEKILQNAAEQEVRMATGEKAAPRDVLPQLAAAKSAGSLMAARQIVPSIEAHFESSVKERHDELARTDKLIAELEGKINEDMALFVDLSNRLSIRTEQVARLRNHKIRLTMERTLYAPPAETPAGGR